MERIKQFRDPKLSLWQSAVSEVVAKRKAGAQTLSATSARTIGNRPDMSDEVIDKVTALCDAVYGGQTIPDIPSPGPAMFGGVFSNVRYCSQIAFKLAEAVISGNKEDQERYTEQLSKFGDCDPLYKEAVLRYQEYFVKGGKAIPYRRHEDLSDFVIDGRLLPDAKVALIADFGTGQQAAKNLLKQIARKNPDVVIHLGDIYYSGTEFEIENYFYTPCLEILELSETGPKPDVYTLSGNHDMYSGGEGYYKLIDKLGQPASYFCLRNDNWQFLAMDTGLHAYVPIGGKPTFLEDREVEWLKDKVANSGARKSILLSHHQLYSAYDEIGDGKHFNQKLYDQLSPILPRVSMWFWGHEHNLVIFKKYMGVLGRCIGYGAFPVGIEEIPSQPKFPDVPVEDVKLSKGPGLYNHGYVMVELDGPTATVSYYQDSDEDNPLFKENI
ncbi:MAG: metallophosphoesterase family protein [Ignavibacteriales bacterium]